MKKKYFHYFPLLFLLILIGQAAFAFYSPTYTKPHYESVIYATTGAKHRNEDLHELNDAAHYFGQTIIGWTKFPNFVNDLFLTVKLPPEATLNAHMQERQNIIFTVSTNSPISRDDLINVKDYIQSKIDEYNKHTDTEFMLTNADYEQVEVIHTYFFGAIIALVISLAAGFAIVFIKEEFSK
jgi:hypothetical protein